MIEEIIQETKEIGQSYIPLIEFAVSTVFALTDRCRELLTYEERQNLIDQYVRALEFEEAVRPLMAECERLMA